MKSAGTRNEHANEDEDDVGSQNEGEFYDEDADYYSEAPSDDGGDDRTDSPDIDSQRIEGKRLFELFAAKLFHERVQKAYLEEVAEMKQQALLEEEAEEKI